MSNVPTTTVIPGTSISPDVIAQLQAAVAPGGAQPAATSSSGLSPLNPYTGQDAANSQAQMAAINAAGPDVFDKAIASVRDDRRAMLEAVAAAGSAGKAEYQRQAELSAASKQSMLSQALASATQRGNSDQGTLDAITARISQPFAEGQSARDAASANWGNLFNAIGVSNDAYLGKYEASLPLIQQQFRSDLATNFATTRADAQREIAKGQQATGLQLAQLQLQAAQTAQAARQRAADQAREDAIRQQEWARQDKQQALDNAYRQQKFDEDVREFGLQYALSKASAASRGSSGGKTDTSYLGLGLGNKGETVPQLLAGIGSAAARVTAMGGPPGGYIGSANAAENMPHTQFVAGLVDQGAGLPKGTTYNAVGGAKAFAVPPIPPTKGTAAVPTITITGQGITRQGFGARVGTTTQRVTYDQARTNPTYRAAAQAITGALARDKASLQSLGFPAGSSPSQAAIRAAVMNSPLYATNRELYDLVMSDYKV